MKFILSDQLSDSCDIRRYVSEQGKWEMGLHRVAFGVRVCLSQIGSFCYSLNYCAQDDELFALTLLATVMAILEHYDEDICPNRIEAEFPPYEVKPIKFDRCWPRLIAMLSELPQSKVSAGLISLAADFYEPDPYYFPNSLFDEEVAHARRTLKSRTPS